jgi:hypothetical protein
MVLGPGLKIHILILIPILKIGPIWIWFLLIQTTTGGFSLVEASMCLTLKNTLLN